MASFYSPRSSGTRQLKRLIIVCPEGAETERSYVLAIKDVFQQEARRRFGQTKQVPLEFTRKNNSSAPAHRLKQLRQETQRVTDGNYSAWLICDRDRWEEKAFQDIQKWVDKNSDKHNWVLNSPNFEYWLELHFEDTPLGRKEKTQFFNKYKKKIKTTDFSYSQIVLAYNRAKQRYGFSDGNLLETDGSEMFRFIKFLANEFGLGDDFK